MIVDFSKVLIKILPSTLKYKVESKKVFQKVFNNISWLVLEKIFRSVLSIIVVAFVARYLGPKNYGIMNYAVSFVGLFSALQTLGLNTIVVRNIVKDHTRRAEYLGTTFFLKIIGSFLMILFASSIIKIIRPDESSLHILVIIASIHYVFKSFMVCDLWFQSQIQSYFSVYVRTVSFFIISSIKLLLVFTQQPLVAFVAMFSLDAVINAIGWIYLYEKKSQDSIQNWRISWDIIKSQLNDSWPLILSNLAVSIHIHIDKVMLGLLLSDVEVGIYSAATKIVIPLNFIAVTISNTVFPSILHAQKKDKNLFYSRLQLLTDILIWTGFALAVIISLISKKIILFVYGKEYIQAAAILMIFVWENIFHYFAILSGKYIVAENITKKQFYRTLIGVLTNIFLNYLFIPVLGMKGAAISSVISVSIQGCFALMLFKDTRFLVSLFKNSINPYRFFTKAIGFFKKYLK